MLFSEHPVTCLNYLSQLKWVTRPRNKSVFVDTRPQHLRQTMESVHGSVPYYVQLISCLA